MSVGEVHFFKKNPRDKSKILSDAIGKLGFDYPAIPQPREKIQEPESQVKRLFQNMKRKIINFNKDEVGDWRAELDCGHYQHVRHKPPLISREWVLTEEGRREKLGVELECKKCEPEYFTLGNLD